MRAPISAVFLALALSLSVEASFEIDPPAPNDRSYVVVQVRDIWRDGCRPLDPHVTRAGNRIEIRWRLPLGLACATAIYPWNADVPLGVLPAGEYELVLNVDDYDGLRRLATFPVVVRESDPAFVVEPDVVGPASTRVAIKTGGCFRNIVVTMDGESIPVESTTIDCMSPVPIIATLPPREPGAATLRVQADDYDERVVAAVRYIDPGALPDRSLYERVLVPVLYDGGGLYGAQWETDVEMINGSFVSPVTFLPEAAKPLVSLAPRSTTSLGMLGNRPEGVVLFVPRDANVRFGGVFRDRSREGSDWGTELPIVRESETTRGVLTLAGVPFDPRYRLHLRIYGIEGQWMPVQVTISRDGESQSVGYYVAGPCGDQRAPCNSDAPTFKSLDLGRVFPSIAGGGSYRVEVAPLGQTYSTRMWAFVTVTNNVTHRVTVITPQ